MSWANAFSLSVSEEELYSATHNNFLGTDPVILRNLGPQYPVKTEHLPTWLNGEMLKGDGGCFFLGTCQHSYTSIFCSGQREDHCSIHAVYWMYMLFILFALF